MNCKQIAYFLMNKLLLASAIKVKYTEFPAWSAL